MANLAPNAMEMVRILASKDGAKNLPDALRQAKSEDLFFWWHEAIAHEMSAALNEVAERKIAEAVASEIAKEAVRRLRP